jgi:hypothetical protein
MLRRIAFVLLLLIALAPAMYAEEWVGYITDEHCGAKGAKAEHGSCAARCAERGAALLLYNIADEQLYKLDDQAAAKAMIGKKVKVAGTKEEEGGIKVTSITEVEAE